MLPSRGPPAELPGEGTRISPWNTSVYKIRFSRILTLMKSARTTNVMFRDIPADLYRDLKVQAATQGIYLKDLLVQYLSEGVQNHKEENNRVSYRRKQG